MKEASNGGEIRRDLKVTATNVTATFVFVASGIAVLLGLLDYPVIGHDAYVHLNWLYQFPSLFAQGVLYPRWLPGSFGGFGAPTFYFYAPLVYWIAGVIRLSGIASPSILYQIVQLLFSFLSLGTCFALLRNYGAEKIAGWLGALVYSFLAYRFCDVFIRDALTEHAALAFLPLLFLRFPNRLRAVVVYSLGWSGLFLTNLPTCYIAVLSVLAVLVAGRFKEGFEHAIAFMVAIAASATYLFPAFALRGLVHQRHLFDLPMNASLFGYALLDIFRGHFDWLRILSIATLLAGIIIVAFPLLKKEGVRVWSLGEWQWIILLAIFLQLPFISFPLWHLIPGMPFVQFSWRWNGVLLLAIVVIWAREHHPPAPSSYRGGGVIYNCILIGLSIITIVCEVTISRNLFSRPPLAYNSYLMDAPEYATKWAANDPSEVIGITLRRMNDPPAVLLGLTMPGDSIALLSKTPREWKFETNLAQPTPVRFHTFYWPYWKAFADSTELKMSPDPNGFATTLLPAGRNLIILQLFPARAERVGWVVSIVGFAVLALLMLFLLYRAITMGREITTPPELTRKM